MRAPRLSALIGGPVATEAPALRPVAVRAMPEVRRIEAVAEPVAAPTAAGVAGVAPVAAKPVPVGPKAGRAEPASAAAQDPRAMPPDEAKPGPKPETARPFAPEAKGVPGLPRPVAPLPVAPPIAVVRVEGPGRGVQRPIESDRSPAPPEPPIRRAVPIELPRVAADPVPPVKPRRVAPPLLPRDPDRLAASAARLGLLPPNPALPSVPAALPDATVKPVSPVAPQMRPETKPPVTGLAKPEADSEPVRRPVVVPSPAAARMAAAKPVPKACTSRPTATSDKRPTAVERV